MTLIDLSEEHLRDPQVLRERIVALGAQATAVRLTGGAPDLVVDLRDLRTATGAPFPPVELVECSIHALDISGAAVTRFTVQDSTLRMVRAVDARVDGTVEIKHVRGPAGSGCHLNFSGLRVEGDLRIVDLDAEALEISPHFLSTTSAVFLQSASVRANLIIADVRATGAVALNGAQVGGSVTIHQMRGGNPESQAVNAESAAIQGTFNLSHGELAGQVHLQNAFVDGSFNATKIHVRGCHGTTIRAEGAAIKGSFILYQARLFHGCVSLLGAEIDGTLDLDGCEIDITGGSGFSAQNFRAAVNIETARISGYLYLRKGTTLVGSLIAPTVTIGGSVDINGATFQALGEPHAIWMANSEVQGRLVIAEATIHGSVDITGCQLGSLAIEAVEFHAEDGDDLPVIRFDDSHGIRALQLNSLAGEVDVFSLRNVSCSSFDDDSTAAWEHLRGRIEFDGFSYDQIERYDGGRIAADARIRLLERAVGEMSAETYRPQPFKRLAHVQDNLGDPVGARRVLSKKRRLEQKHVEGPLTRPFSAMFGGLFDYGLDATRAIFTTLVAVLVTVTLVTVADGPAEVLKVEEDDKITAAPCSQQVDLFWYSIDLLIPVIDLKTSSKCGIRPLPATDGVALGGYVVGPETLWRFAWGGLQFLGWIIVSGLALTLSGAFRRT